MGYYTRVFCTKGNIPSLKELLDWVGEKGYSVSVDNYSEKMDLSSNAWEQYAILYKKGKLPILVNCDHNNDRENSLFNEEIEESLEKIGKPGMSFAKRKVIKHLRNTKFIIACQLPTSDIDDDGYDANGEIMNYFVKNCGGMPQADGEGFYDGHKLILRENETSEKPVYGLLEVSPSQTEEQLQPTFSELSVTDQTRLDSQRQLVISVLNQKYGISTLHKDKTDLAFLQKLLDDNVFSPVQTVELQSMGVVFGDALASELGLCWVMITDEYGTDPTLQIPGTKINFNALTMISKRVERGEAVNIKLLLQVVEAEVERRRGL